MTVAEQAQRFENMKHDFYTWREHAGMEKKAALALGFAVLTALAAQVRVYLPWTPVPVTGQTLSIFLGALVLGRWWGGISALLYLSLGFMGLPVFAGMKGGMAVILGPTGGYLMGMMLSAFFLGSMADHSPSMRKAMNLGILMALANLVLVYGLGLVQLYFWSMAVTGSQLTLAALVSAGFLPFIAGDMVKIGAATLLGRMLTTQKRYR